MPMRPSQSTRLTSGARLAVDLDRRGPRCRRRGRAGTAAIATTGQEEQVVAARTTRPRSGAARRGPPRPRSHARCEPDDRVGLLLGQRSATSPRTIMRTNRLALPRRSRRAGGPRRPCAPASASAIGRGARASRGTPRRPGTSGSSNHVPMRRSASDSRLARRELDSPRDRRARARARRGRRAGGRGRRRCARSDRTR